MEKQREEKGDKNKGRWESKRKNGEEGTRKGEARIYESRRKYKKVRKEAEVREWLRGERQKRVNQMNKVDIVQQSSTER